MIVGFYLWKLVKTAFLSKPKRRNDDVNIKNGGRKENDPHIPDDEGDYIDYEEVD